jgi:hypothetical protein
VTRLLPLLGLFAVACADTGADDVESGNDVETCVPDGAAAGVGALSDWTLDDRNSSSLTHGEDLSPRCLLDRIGLYYMLDAT